MYENVKTFETTLCGRPFKVVTGKYAWQANGACMIYYGDTVIMATATASAKPRDGIDFLPLSVDFNEKLYSVGKIPGSFLKREGKPSDKAVLASRVIDRPIRPLFPKDLRNDVTLDLTVMSVDPDCSPEVAGLIGASIALSISDIPWNGPVSSVIAGLVDGQVVLNPTAEQKKTNQMTITVASSATKVVMIEAGCNEIEDQVVYDAIMTAHEENQKMVKFINDITAEIGLPKFEYESCELDHDMFEEIKAFCVDKVRAALDTDNKMVRDAAIAKILDEIHAEFDEKYEEFVPTFGEVIYKIQKFVVREWLLQGKRVDGRGLTDVRPLYAEVGMLPRVHGSGLFSRGQTQVLSTVTLGAIKEQQLLDGIDDEEFKRYIHHYNMPSYSVGETRPSRGPGRREIGHGALAERALLPVIPSEEEFPYAIRVVSEVLSSNGSTSQGSVCGSTLALMDAGVPIKAPVAGISCGLITQADGSHLTFTDIQGIEDFFGDMDFKVAVTHKGITAIQMDLKIDGLTPQIISEAFEKTRVARFHILDDVMLKAIPAPRAELSKYAPKMLHMKIEVDKIREVIGKGGSVIQKICADFDVKVDIDDDGNVFIGAVDSEKGEAAMNYIKLIVTDPKVGDTYIGKVVKVIEVGAIVEFAPGKDGLVHISELDTKRVAKVEDVVEVGDTIRVKVMAIKNDGKISLSRKAALAELAAAEAAAE